MLVGKALFSPTSPSDTHPSLPLLQSNDTSVEAYDGDPEDDEEYEEEEQVSDNSHVGYVFVPSPTYSHSQGRH